MTVKQDIRAAAASVRQVNRARAVPSRPSKLFALIAGMRPVSGPRLYAHTIAALEMLGISRTSPASADRLQAMIGPRAMSYHAKVTHNLEVKGDNVKLSRTGVEFFQAREADGKAPRDLIDAFKAVFRTGKPSDAAEVKAHHIGATPV